MGKIDQGVIMHWVISHMEKKELSYIGYGGEGKQVRDVLHIHDLCRLIAIQISDMNRFSGTCYNVGGGLMQSVSLQELTVICRELTGNSIRIHQEPKTRPNDLIWYVTDNTRITQDCGWQPLKSVRETVTDIATWIIENRTSLLHLINPGC